MPRRRPQGVRVPATTSCATSWILRRESIAAFCRNRHDAASDEGVLVHQPALGPVDDLARLEALGEVGVLVLERDDLLEAAERHLDRGDEVALLERLHEVRERARVAGLVDEIVLRERGEDQHRGESLARDRAGRGEAVHPRHLDVEDREIGIRACARDRWRGRRGRSRRRPRSPLLRGSP